MALQWTVFTPITKTGTGGLKTRYGTVTLDASYVNATGWTVAASDMKLPNSIKWAQFGNGNGYQPAWDQANKKLRLYKGNTEAATNEAGANGIIVAFEAFGS